MGSAQREEVSLESRSDSSTSRYGSDSVDEESVEERACLCVEAAAAHQSAVEPVAWTHCAGQLAVKLRHRPNVPAKKGVYLWRL